jgi:uroporphyrin-III C-methyltransferase / precorrin-2 dehydrogenase / sirohydrochlorin ferrochelatase
MTLLPIFLNLTNRNCLLVGAGNVALDKITSMLTTGLSLRVIAPEARIEIQQLALEGKLDWIERRFEPSDLDGNFLVIAATNSPQVNSAVYQGCVERNIPCNSVDDIPNCDFFFASVVSRGNLQIAISTSGESPAVAQRLRREIDAQLPSDFGKWLGHLGQLRREVLAMHPRSEARKSLLHQLAQRQVCESATCPSRLMALAPLAEKRGIVSLVGAGPGHPDLLTVKALRFIQAADVILHDDLVPQAILQLASPTAELLNVGKRCGAKTITQDEINALMIHHARANRSVVRLKSGDPLIFGRAAEEMASLREAGVDFQVVPGITSAFAAAAAIGCSLTDRNSASNVTFSTGHHAQSHNHSPLPEIEDTTRVVYMPGRDLNLLAEEWLQQGLPPDFPCAVVSHAGQPSEQIQYATLAALGALASLPAPSLLIAGWTVRNTAAAVQSAAAVDQITA